MKILTKYNRANIVTTVAILLISSAAYYSIIRGILLDQLDRDLKVEEQEIFDYVKENNQLPNASNYKGQEILFEKAALPGFERTVKSTTTFNPAEHEDEPIRMLTFPVKVNGTVYKAIVIKSQVETEDLLQLIVLITGAIFLLLLVITSVINRFILNKLWQPFYYTLQQLRSFNVANTKPLSLPATNLSEFTELNASVNEMTKRVSKEFESLKSFTENASHEMQTPLAIINSKLDLLLQTVTEEQAGQVQAIYDATNRLSKLNQTLLLLTKIDNQQYNNTDVVDLKALAKTKFQQFDELVKNRNIEVTLQLNDAHVPLNKELADILLNNLISNAIKHNYSGGNIQCVLTTNKLSISNSGTRLTFDQSNIFNRFQKSDVSDGTGLGLAVVKQICDRYNFSISYSTMGDNHTFAIAF